VLGDEILWDGVLVKNAYYMPNSRVRNYRDIIINGSPEGRDLHKSLKLLLKEYEKGLRLLLISVRNKHNVCGKNESIRF